MRLQVLKDSEVKYNKEKPFPRNVIGLIYMIIHMIEDPFPWAGPDFLSLLYIIHYKDTEAGLSPESYVLSYTG